MKSQENVIATHESGYRITLNKQNQDLQRLFSQFKQDFSNIPSLSLNQNKNFLTTGSLTERPAPKTKSKEKKRMKLIDYIYIKNTTKKNQHTSKIDKKGISANQLRKSRMKEGQSRAYKAIVDDMVSELKQISAQALSMAEVANENFNQNGNTDDIAKLCNIRRILKENILGKMAEIQKLIGVETNAFESKSRQKIEQEQKDDLNSKLLRLQAIGVRRLQPEVQYVQPFTDRGIEVRHKYSNKDTWISQKEEYREDF